MAGPRFSVSLTVHDADGAQLPGLKHAMAAVQHLAVRNESPRPYEFQAWSTPDDPVVFYPEAATPTSAKFADQAAPGAMKVGEESVLYEDPIRSSSRNVGVAINVDVRGGGTSTWTTLTLPHQFIICGP